MRKLFRFFRAVLLAGATVGSQAHAADLQLYRPPSLDEATQTWLKVFVSHPAITAAGLKFVELAAPGNYLNDFSDPKIKEARFALVSLDLLLARGLMSNSPAVTALSQPGQFPDVAKLFDLEDSAIGDAVLSEVNRQEKLVPISFWSRGQSTLLDRDGRIKSADDLKGIKISTLSPLGKTIVDSVGATGVQSPGGEIMAALVAGAHDAADLPSATALAINANSQTVKSIATQYRPTIGFFIANAAGWDRLKEREKAAIGEAARDADIAARAAVKDVDKKLADAAAASGLTVINLAQSDPAGFRALNENFLTTQFLETSPVSLGIVRSTRDLADAKRDDIVPPSATFTTGGVPVLFVTDRVDEGGADATRRFGGEAEVDVKLVCGQLAYASGKTITLGEEYKDKIEVSPATLPTDFDPCVKFVSESLKKYNLSRILLFIHGFSNTFEFSARRAITLANAIGFDGIVLLWSWPSDGRAKAYMHDEMTNRRTQRIVPLFADALAAAPELKRIDVLAHSMGNRIAIVLGDELRKSNSKLPLVSIVFAAADEDRLIFGDIIKDMNSKVPALAKYKTIYAARYDRPLQVSGMLHGGRAERVGLGGDKTMILAGVESVDATDVEGGVLGSIYKLSHSYVFDVPKAIYDLKALLMGDTLASQRGLSSRASPSGKGTYWEIPK